MCWMKTGERWERKGFMSDSITFRFFTKVGSELLAFF